MNTLLNGCVLGVKSRIIILPLVTLLMSFAVFLSASAVTANETPKEPADAVFGLQELPKTAGKEAWIVDTENVPLIDKNDRVIGRLFFQAPVTLLEETPQGSRIRVSGWLEVVFPEEAQIGEGGKFKTPWRGADIVGKVDWSNKKTIGEVNKETQFHYLRRILDKDSHFYEVVLEGYIPSSSLTMDYGKTTIPGTVSGRVTSKGNPAVGLKVALFNWRDHPAMTDAEGRFLLKQVPPGQHAVCWRNQGASSWTYFMMGGSGRGALKPGGHLDLGDIDIGE